MEWLRSWWLGVLAYPAFSWRMYTLSLLGLGVVYRLLGRIRRANYPTLRSHLSAGYPMITKADIIQQFLLDVDPESYKQVKENLMNYAISRQRKDYTAVALFLSDSITLEYTPTRLTHHGKTACIDFLQALEGALVGFQMEALGVKIGPQGVSVEWLCSGRFIRNFLAYEATGLDIQFRMVEVMDWQPVEHLFHRIRLYVDSEEPFLRSQSNSLSL